jgi:hypothetical protein
MVLSGGGRARPVPEVRTALLEHQYCEFRSQQEAIVRALIWRGPKQIEERQVHVDQPGHDRRDPEGN